MKQPKFAAVLLCVLVSCASRQAPGATMTAVHTNPSDPEEDAARHVRASEDPSLSARIVGRRALVYSTGPDGALDRPGYVRAASGIAWLGPQLAVVQDDANFIALVDPRGVGVEPVTLPAGPHGRRLFDKERGNAGEKFDFEACLATSEADQHVLYAFGSGSKAQRYRVARVALARGEAPAVSLIDAARLYQSWSTQQAFAGSELNVEGVVRSGASVFVLQRGNGAVHGDLHPVDAILELPFTELMAYLKDPDRAPLPRHAGPVSYDLGRADGVRLTFTDGAAGPSGLLYLASAEGSPNTREDGRVHGAAVGVITAGGHARYARLLDERGRPSLEKVEGIELSRDRPGRAHVVVDPDDPAVPATLLEVELAGFPL